MNPVKTGKEKGRVKQLKRYVGRNRGLENQARLGTREKPYPRKPDSTAEGMTPDITRSIGGQNDQDGHSTAAEAELTT